MSISFVALNIKTIRYTSCWKKKKKRMFIFDLFAGGFSLSDAELALIVSSITGPAKVDRYPFAF